MPVQKKSANLLNAPRKLAYQNSELGEGSAVQVQLAEFFIDALNNPFIKEDVARADPTTLLKAFLLARERERLY